MGAMSFQLPGEISDDARRELERACLVGGYDHTPVPTRVRLENQKLIVAREPDESGYLIIPWTIAEFGTLMGSTSTLMERVEPSYRLTLELARGKVNQVRNQLADWRMMGLIVPQPLEDTLRAATKAFGQAILAGNDPQYFPATQQALLLAYRAGDGLIQAYINQILNARKQQTPTLETLLSARLHEVPTGKHAEAYLRAFNSVAIDFGWRTIEPQQAKYQFAAVDSLLAWAAEHHLPVSAGPLIDFSQNGLPDWVLESGDDPANLAGLMCDYIDTVVTRYRDKIRRWTITAASNNSEVLGLTEDELIRLTARLAESAWQVDTQLEIVVGIAQPWGEYLAGEDHTYSPYIFADTLLRAGLPFAAFDLELLMGVSPRGSYCRDLLDTSRLLDTFAMLGTPLQVTLGYPASDDLDMNADSTQLAGNAGRWRDGFSVPTQADWAADYGILAVCKPYVALVSWSHFSDAHSHLVPNGGLVDTDGNLRPAIEQLMEIRDLHLR